MGALRAPPAPVVPLIVPGWRDSGAGHWQSLWAQRLPGALRVVQQDWMNPSRDAWVSTLARTIVQASAPVVVVAHSLGCIATVHLPREAARRVQAALLVAPADPERRAVLHDFAPVPYERLPYRSIVVASSNDPYCPARLAGAYARAWAASSCACPMRGTSTWSPGTANGPSVSRCCRRWPLRPAPRSRRSMTEARERHMHPSFCSFPSSACSATMHRMPSDPTSLRMRQRARCSG